MLKAALSTRPATKKQSSNNRSLHFVLISVVKREALGAPFAPASGVSLPESGMLTEVEISDVAEIVIPRNRVYLIEILSRPGLQWGRN